MIEATEAGVALGVQSAVVFVLITIDLLQYRARIESLTLLLGATATCTLGVELTKLTLSELEGVCLMGHLKEKGQENEETQTKFGFHHF